MYGMILFGNKSDLAKEEWKVNEKEGKTASEKFKLTKHLLKP